MIPRLAVLKKPMIVLWREKVMQAEANKLWGALPFREVANSKEENPSYLKMFLSGLTPLPSIFPYRIVYISCAHW